MVVLLKERTAVLNRWTEYYTDAQLLYQDRSFIIQTRTIELADLPCRQNNVQSEVKIVK